MSMQRPTPTSKPASPPRDKHEKLLISVTSGLIGVFLGGLFLYLLQTVGILVAIPVTLLCTLIVPLALRMVHRF